MLQRTFAGTTDDQGAITITLRFNGSMRQPVIATKVAIKTVTCYPAASARGKGNAPIPVDCALDITVTPSNVDPLKFLMDDLFPKPAEVGPENQGEVQDSIAHAGCDKCVPMFEVCDPRTSPYLAPLNIESDQPVRGRNFTVRGTLTFAGKDGPLKKGTKVAGRFFLYFYGDPVGA